MNARHVFLIIAGVLTLVVLVAWLIWGETDANPFLIVGSWDSSVQKDTTETTPGSPTTPSGGSSNTIIEDGHLVSIIRYDGKTFSPRVLVINRGNGLRFINTGSNTMRISMTTTGAQTTLKQYTQAESVGKGGIYEISLSEPGTWSITNLNGDPKINAVISVQ